MRSKVMLLNPARHFIANQAGLGYLTPLGLVLLGGPLLDAGFNVRLVDHDMNCWTIKRLLQEVGEFQPKYILLGHSGSTASHNVAVATIKEIKTLFPHIRIVYGGVYPSYAYQTILVDVPEIDVIVRGEGEKTIVELLHHWEENDDLGAVLGVAWRNANGIVVNHPCLLYTSRCV